MKLAHNYETWVHQMKRLLECEGLKICFDKVKKHDLENFSQLEEFKCKQNN